MKTKIQYTRGGVNYVHTVNRIITDKAEAEAELIMHLHIGRSQISNIKLVRA